MIEFKSYEEFKSRAIPVKQGEMIYWGNAEYIRTVEPGMFKSSQYKIMPANTPCEQKLLKQLLEAAKGTKWEVIIKEKLESKF